MIFTRTRPDRGRADIPKVGQSWAASASSTRLGAIYGAGAQTVFLGFLLILAGIPIHVWIKWRNARARSRAAVRTSRGRI